MKLQIVNIILNLFILGMILYSTILQRKLMKLQKESRELADQILVSIMELRAKLREIEHES